MSRVGEPGGVISHLGGSCRTGTRLHRTEGVGLGGPTQGTSELGRAWEGGAEAFFTPGPGPCRETEAELAPERAPAPGVCPRRPGPS